ncbi:MAG TPA: DUF983 domain-containing protein [Candidatus Didemnitutus sp.]|nr:DUF983 domain-containing protein [Candidatus Didemnitutus sp.]
MNVTQGQILSRGFKNCCPNCGSKTLFRADKFFELNKSCPSCGLKLEKDEGFFLGAMSLNYGVTCVCFLAPIAILWYKEVLSDTMAAVIGIAAALIVPIVLYRASRSWQLMLYYYFLPQHLPANRRTLAGDEDENV